MRNVIPFPTVKEKLNVEKIGNPTDFLITKSFEFTCPHCKTKAKFEQENIVFKRLTFYCGGCGSLHTVVNPAFREK